MKPTNRAEYIERAKRNQYIDGYGIDTTSHLACPFCGAPEFAAIRIIDFREGITENRTCRECGRSAKGLLCESMAGTTLEMVQTGGDDPDEWIPPMRRVK